MDELLDLLHDIDQEEGDFDMQEGSTSDYVKRVKKLFQEPRKNMLGEKEKVQKNVCPRIALAYLHPYPKSITIIFVSISSNMG